ncbi:MAG: dihydrofolate reductase family protein [Pseudomonadales bacterium]
MRELAILTFVSADGVMQAPKMQEEDTSGGFTQGGWANPCWDNVMESVGEVAMSKPYDVLLGRNTYDAFAPHHSANDSPLNRLTKYVVTSRPISTPWQPTIEIRQDVIGTIEKLKAEDGPLLQVHGSHGLVQLLLQHGLIDEYRIWTFPVLLGSGKRLFGDGTIPANIVLQASEALTSGAVMSIYRKSE